MQQKHSADAASADAGTTTDETGSMIVERFAPSPTGLLHLGHAYSAWRAWRSARDSGGRFLLRLEDLDTARVRPEYASAIERDLAWLGLDWDGPVLCQSDRKEAYAEALASLQGLGLVYACRCTRRDIREALSAPQEVSFGSGNRTGPDGPVYPGTCRLAGHGTEESGALRLDMAKAVATLGGASSVAQLSYVERENRSVDPSGVCQLDPAALIEGTGDIVLARKDGVAAYHLAVVVDDAFQGVSHVTRGEDLASATPIHRVLQALLNLPTPSYCHHRLVRDDNGRRLAKRDDARAIALYRDEGLGPRDVLALAGISDPPD